MSKKYTPAIFQPTVRPSWAGVMSYISAEEKSKILEAILNYPNNTEIESRFWNETIKPDLDMQYESFVNTCLAKGRGAKDYWNKQVKEKDNISLPCVNHMDNSLKDKDKDKDENENNNQDEKQDDVQVVDKDKKKRASVVSEDWRPKEETIKKLEQKNLDVEKVIDKFINSCQASGRKYIDFDRAILSWNWEYDNSVKKRIIELPSSTYDSKKYDGMSSMAEMIKKQSMEKAMKKFGGGL